LSFASERLILEAQVRWHGVTSEGAKQSDFEFERELHLTSKLNSASVFILFSFKEHFPFQNSSFSKFSSSIGLSS
jgi:hypothetical protein